MAEGAGLPFAQLLVLNCGEEFTAGEPVGRRGRPAAGAAAAATTARPWPS